MDVKVFKRYSLFVSGLILLGMGISLTIIASQTLGIGAWDAINTRLNVLNPIFSIGNYLIMVAGCACLLAGVISREVPKLHYLVTSVLLGFTVDISLNLYQSTIPNINHYLAFILGLIIIAIGTHTYLYSKLLVSPLDYLMQAFMQRFNLNIGIAKIIVEVIAIVVAIIINAPLSYGTLIIMFGLGPLYSITEKPSKKIIEIYMK